MELKYEDLKVLIEMEELSHELIHKYIQPVYNDDGEITNKEYELWTNYWNLVEKMIQEINEKRGE